MIRILLLISFLCFAFVLSAQNSYSETSDTVETKIIESSSTQYEKCYVTMKNGIREGRCFCISRDSVIIREGRFINDLQEGKVLFYDQNGEFEGFETFKNGKMNGLSCWFSEKGDTLYYDTFENGLLNGNSRFFYSNGRIQTEYKYEQGILINTTNYRRNGKIKKHCLFPW